MKYSFVWWQHDLEVGVSWIYYMMNALLHDECSVECNIFNNEQTGTWKGGEFRRTIEVVTIVGEGGGCIPVFVKVCLFLYIYIYISFFCSDLFWPIWLEFRNF